MQKSKTTLISYTIVVILTILVIHSFFKINKLKSELALVIESKTVAVESETNNSPLATIDSILFNGRYDEALRAYEDRLRVEKDSSKIYAIKQRIVYVSQLIELESSDLSNRNTLAEGERQISQDNNNTITPLEIRKYDSLNFALAKAKLQISNLIKRLEQKSVGEYITFESSKGRQVHYVGAVRDNMANGKGIALLSSGSRYEGEWLNNKRHGLGTFHWPDGEYYEGNYKEDKRHGFGTYYWPNGEKFSGNWENDKRNGEGEFYGKDGKIIKGNWKKDELIELYEK